MSEKLCMFCKHVEYERPWNSDSDSGTSFSGGGFSCNKKHFYEGGSYSLEDFREVMLKAEKCPDYEQVKP